PEPLGEAQPTTPAPQQNAAQQTLDMNSVRKSRDDNKMVNQLGTDVDTVEDMDIFDANGRKIAEVEGVIEDQNGQIVGLIIEHGGFLGLGETESIITFDQVELQNGNLKTTMTEESLPQLQRWTRD